MKGRTFTNLISEEKVTSHDAVLHTLDREYRYGDEILTMNSDAFEATLNDWLNAKVIFGTYHPDMDLGYYAPGLSVAVNNAVEVGKITKAWIDKTGHARLFVTFEFSGEHTDEIEKLIGEGLLSLSSGFHSIDTVDEYGRLVFTKVTPNHVLLFMENEWNQPRDQSSGIVNKEDENMTEELAKTNAKLTVEKEELTARLSKAEAENKALTDALNAKTNELKAADAKVSALEAESEKHKIEALELEWSAIVSTLPAAVTTDAAKLDAEKKEFMADPGLYARKMVAATAKTSKIDPAKTNMAGSVNDGADGKGNAEMVRVNGKFMTVAEYEDARKKGMI